MKALEGNKLKLYIKAGKYEKAVYTLRHILIDNFTKRIQEKKQDFEYTDMLELIKASEKYLEEKIKRLPRYIDNFDDEPIDYADELDRMLEIYSILKNS